MGRNALDGSPEIGHIAMDIAGIGKRIEEVRGRIRRACERAGRDPNEVTLVAVTKTFPAEAVSAAHDADVKDFGENKAQEFVEKFEAVDPATNQELRWHFIGHLQRNKIKLVVGRAHVIHGIDSVRLARALQDHAEKEDLLLKCLIQVNVSGEESKFGLDPEALAPILREVRGMDRIAWSGLMTLASPTDDEDRLRREFRLLKRCLIEARDIVDSMEHLSMGMSSDFEIAIEEGATHVRLGSVIFGDRDS